MVQVRALVARARLGAHEVAARAAARHAAAGGVRVGRAVVAGHAGRMGVLARRTVRSGWTAGGEIRWGVVCVCLSVCALSHGLSGLTQRMDCRRRDPLACGLRASALFIVCLSVCLSD